MSTKKERGQQESLDARVSAAVNERLKSRIVLSRRNFLVLGAASAVSGALAGAGITWATLETLRPNQSTQNKPSTAELTPSAVTAKLSRIDSELKKQGKTPVLLRETANLAAASFAQHIENPPSTASQLAEAVKFFSSSDYHSQVITPNLACTTEASVRPTEVGTSDPSKDQISVNIDTLARLQNQKSYAQDLFLSLTSLMHGYRPSRLIGDHITLLTEQGIYRLIYQQGFSLYAHDPAISLPNKVCLKTWGELGNAAFLFHSNRALAESLGLKDSVVFTQAEPLARFMQKEVYDKGLADPKSTREKFLKSQAIEFYTEIGQRKDPTSPSPFITGISHFDGLTNYR